MNGTLLIGLAGIAALVAQEVLHRKEREDLLNRIMARDYGDYRDAGKPQKGGSVANPLRERLRQKGDRSLTPGGIDHGDKR